MKLVKPKSRYKGVAYNYRKDTGSRKPIWRMSFQIEGMVARKDFPFTDEGEKQAAKAYDLKRIEFNKEPVNILKKKI